MQEETDVAVTDEAVDKTIFNHLISNDPLYYIFEINDTFKLFTLQSLFVSLFVPSIFQFAAVTFDNA